MIGEGALITAGSTDFTQIDALPAPVGFVGHVEASERGGRGLPFVAGFEHVVVGHWGAMSEEPQAQGGEKGGSGEGGHCG